MEWSDEMQCRPLYDAGVAKAGLADVEGRAIRVGPGITDLTSLGGFKELREGFLGNVITERVGQPMQQAFVVWHEGPWGSVGRARSAE